MKREKCTKYIFFIVTIFIVLSAIIYLNDQRNKTTKNASKIKETTDLSPTKSNDEDIAIKEDNYIENNDKAVNSNKEYSEEEYNFFVTSDIHYFSPKLHDDQNAFKKFKETGDGKNIDYIDEITDAFLYESSTLMPDAVVLTGDLTLNGEKQSHLDLAEKLKKLEESGVNVYVIPGNHDINNPYARSFKGDKSYITEYIKETDFDIIYGDFGYNEAISRDKTSLSYLVKTSDNLYFLMLDTNVYYDNITEGISNNNGTIREETIEWVKQCVADVKKNNGKIITFMHHNLLLHNKMFDFGFRIYYANKVLQEFLNMDLDIVFSGHIHIQNIAKEKAKNKEIHEIVSSALSVNPVQYGVFTYTEKESKYHTKIIDMKKYATKNQLNDNNLLNFTQYSKEFFAKKSVSKLKNTIYKDDSLTDKEKESIISTVEEVNLRYFSGDVYKIKDKILNSQTYNLIQNKDLDMILNYLNSIFDSELIDGNNLTITYN